MSKRLETVDIIRTHHATELITFVSTIHNDLLEELGIAINDDDKPSFNVYLLFYVIDSIWLNMIGIILKGGCFFQE